MNAAKIDLTVESWRDLLHKARHEGRKVEFSESAEGDGTVVLKAKISHRKNEEPPNARNR